MDNLIYRKHLRKKSILHTPTLLTLLFFDKQSEHGWRGWDQWPRI